MSRESSSPDEASPFEAFSHAAEDFPLSPPRLSFPEPYQSDKPPLSNVSKSGESSLDETPWLMDRIGWDKYFEGFDDHGPLCRDEEIDGMHEMTDSESKQYALAVKARGGFDVPELPNVSACGLITPLGELTIYDHEDLKPHCESAIADFNGKECKKFEFVRLKKANTQAARGINYYLTFEARNSEDDSFQVFQALVLEGFPEKEDDDDDDCPLTVLSSKPKLDSGI